MSWPPPDPGEWHIRKGRGWYTVAIVGFDGTEHRYGWFQSFRDAHEIRTYLASAFKEGQ